MGADASVVSNLAASTQSIARYWEALHQKALARLDARPSDATPVRSYLWPRLIYSPDLPKRLAALPLAHWFESEREEFSGMPMRDPGSFLRRLGEEDPARFAFADRQAVMAGPNEKLAEALDLIAAAWPEARKELDAAVLGVAWIERPKARLYSASDPQRFGLIYVNAGHFSEFSSHRLATALIHETAHHALFVETARDPLIPADFKTPVYSPLRKEMRPAIGALHAAFTIVRVGQWAQRLQKRDHAIAATEEIRRIHEAFVGGLRETLKALKVVRFSQRGMTIYEELEELTGPLEALTK